MPPQWSQYIHPEGKAYFWRDSGLSIVTEACMYDPETAEKVCVWATEVERQLECQGYPLDNLELFLETDNNDYDCSYYLVNRATNSVFWLLDYSTTDLGIRDVVSDSHLKILFEAQYWTHIENFCMHFGGLPQKAIDDLILVFLHAHADNLTSNLSTFPYTAMQCQNFLKLLQSSRDNIREGHVVTFVGRIWAIILYNRYETHYGQEQSRLSRDCAILPEDITEVQWTRRLLSLLSLRTADRYLQTLDALFVDKFVYGHVWNTFMGTCLRTWRQDCCASAILLLLHIVCFFLPVLKCMAYTSGLLASTSLLAGIFLIHRHEQLDVVEAQEAQVYLSGVRSEYFKFQGVAAAYSLPRVFLLVGFITFFSQWAVLIWSHIGIICTVPLIFFILGFFMVLEQSTSQTRSVLRPLASKTMKLCHMFSSKFQRVEDQSSTV